MAGQVLRLPLHWPATVAITWTPADVGQRRGCTKMTVHKTFQKDFQRFRIMWEEVEDVAADWSRWQQAAA